MRFPETSRPVPFLSDAEHAALDRANREPPDGWAAHSVRERARCDRLAVAILQERLHDAETRAFWLEEFYRASLVMVQRRDARIAQLEQVLDQALRVHQALGRGA